LTAIQNTPNVIDAVDGVLTYTPASGYTGGDSFLRVLPPSTVSIIVKFPSGVQTGILIET